MSDEQTRDMKMFAERRGRAQLYFNFAVARTMFVMGGGYSLTAQDFLDMLAEFAGIEIDLFVEKHQPEIKIPTGARMQ